MKFFDIIDRTFQSDLSQLSSLFLSLLLMPLMQTVAAKQDETK